MGQRSATCHQLDPRQAALSCSCMQHRCIGHRGEDQAAVSRAPEMTAAVCAYIFTCGGLQHQAAADTECLCAADADRLQMAELQARGSSSVGYQQPDAATGEYLLTC